MQPIIAEEVVMLDFLPSPFGMSMRIALAEKESSTNTKKKICKTRATSPPKFTQKNPVLIHNGKPICESLITIEYIYEVWNDKSPLVPSNPLQHALARFWADYVKKKIYLCGRGMCMSKGEDQEKANELIECLKLLEGELGENNYFGGESLGFMDVVLVPFYTWFYSYETYGNLNLEAEVPKLVAWAKRCLSKESVVKSLPNPKKLYEFI